MIPDLLCLCCRYSLISRSPDYAATLFGRMFCVLAMIFFVIFTTMLSIFIVKHTSASRPNLRLFDSEKSQCAVQLSPLGNGIEPLHVGSSAAVAAQFSVGLTEPRHRHFHAIAPRLDTARRK
ncbi:MULTISPECIES: hypothetical protein [unclassified Bradyrhizobium]|uniref:hypothetical protein n=1 Tax=unclassified Bradyrhizobium TaxID=2631580 RepID=UPI0029168A9F|nr:MULTISPECIES: hypothetical protein [unclassified Bradyrhizobium]